MYPRTVNIESDKLKGLLVKKGELITLGRGKSSEIETLEQELTEIDLKVQEEEKKVNIDDLLEREKAETKTVEECIEKMKAIKQEIYERMKAQTSPDLHTKYDEVKKKKEDLELERSKIAIKAQKFNDKIIPLAKVLMKPFLQDQYDDYDTLQLEGDEIIATVFNHLNDFKTNFKKK